MIALGVERTIAQDPAFAARIMVDVATGRCLPAINEPTTAVQVIDHLSDVLRLIGGIDLSGSHWTGDPYTQVGLVFPIRRWGNYLTLATTEIRLHGSSAIQ